MNPRNRMSNTLPFLLPRHSFTMRLLTYMYQVCKKSTWKESKQTWTTRTYISLLFGKNHETFVCATAIGWSMQKLKWSTFFTTCLLGVKLNPNAKTSVFINMYANKMYIQHCWVNFDHTSPPHESEASVTTKKHRKWKLQISVFSFWTFHRTF